MALITCPKCGKQFSEHAEACPVCGIKTSEALLLIQKRVEEIRLESEQKAAERERIRKEHEAKVAEEARIRAEKRAEWWKKNKKKVIVVFIAVFALVVALFIALFIANKNSTYIEVLDYTICESGGKRIEYKYNKYGEKIEEYSYELDSNRWESNTKTLYEYENNKLTKKIKYYYIHNKWEVSDTHEYIYNDNCLIRDITYDSDGKQDYKIEYVYDENGRLKSEIPYRITYTYDKNGRVEESWLEDGYTIINENGYKTKEVKYEGGLQYKYECYETEYFYDDNGCLSKEVSGECHEGYVTTTIYDNKGNICSVDIDYCEDGHFLDNYENHYTVKRFKLRKNENNTTGVNNSTGIENTTETFTVNGVSFKMVQVPGGTFTMGATPEQGGDADIDEKSVHQVTLGDYYIGQTEVTQALWRAVMGSSPSWFKGDSRPVECVSWNDCQDFIKKLNASVGRTFRLPTEAEWEYAARGGNKSKGYKYAGGDDIGSVAWYDKNSYDKGEEHPDYGTHDVATKSPNELGLYDMSGNVWEWCSDWYGGYSGAPQTNPTGPSSGSDRVRRGGGWFSNAQDCRVSNRYGDFPDDSFSCIGLRLVLLP